MLKRKERQIVLDYLYQECMAESKDQFIIRSKMTCKLESKMKYEHLSNKEKLEVYKSAVRKKIINYLIDGASKSLAIDWVNGCPKKREMRVREWAFNHYDELSKAEKIAICEKLNLTYMG